MTLIARICEQDPRRRFVMAAVMRAWIDGRGKQAIERAVAARARTWRPQG